MNKQIFYALFIIITLAFAGCDYIDSPDDDTLAERIDTLETSLEVLAERVRIAEGNIYDASVIFENVDKVGDTIVFTGVNIQIKSGAGSTDGINGFGNLIIGYNETRNVESIKTGSHNIIVGANHNYSSYGGIVAGYYNTIIAPYASVLGGKENWSKAPYSTILGGWSNYVNGDSAAISGGQGNFAGGFCSSVSGGFEGSSTTENGWAVGAQFPAP